MEDPTGSGWQLSLRDTAGDLSDRLAGIWQPAATVQRQASTPVVADGVDPATPSPA